jgi:peroxiredoxin
MQCRAHVAQLGRLYPELQAAGAEVLVILGDSMERAGAYAQSLKAPFPVLADPERKVYGEYGLDRAMVVIQRTASIVVDGGGTIQYMKKATNPMTWLQDSRELVDIVRGLGKPATWA